MSPVARAAALIGCALLVAPMAAGADGTQGPAAAAAAASTASAPDPRAAGAEAEYERQFIGFERVIFYRSPRAGGPSAKLELATRWGEPFLGRDRRALSRTELFQLLERPDLNARGERRATTRRALWSTGTALLAAGVLTTIGGAVAGQVHPGCFEQDRMGSCIDADHSANGPLLGVGVGVAVVGLVGIIAGVTHDPSPASDFEIHQLVLRHNRELRRALGLPPREDPRYPDESDQPPVVDVGGLPPPPPRPPDEVRRPDPRLFPAY